MQSRFGAALLGLSSSMYMLKRTNDISESEQAKDEVQRAVCILDPQPGQVAKGIVWFEQDHFSDIAMIDGRFTGLRPNHLHGFHIHQYGDLTNGCLTAGPHYNPFNMTHGGPDDEIRHVGDLGNV